MATSPRPGDVHERTVAGRTFRCSNRTYWHLLWTIWWLRLRFPLARLQILQSCYHSGYALSQGTHDYDAVLDVWITGGVLGRDHWRAQKVLRRLGWAAFFRCTGSWAARSSWHFHMISLPLGLPARPSAQDVGRAYARLGIKVGEFIDGGWTTKGRITGSSQVVDYFNHAEGLKDQHAQNDDASWHPKDINKTVFRRSWLTNHRTAA